MDLNTPGVYSLATQLERAGNSFDKYTIVFDGKTTLRGDLEQAFSTKTESGKEMFIKSISGLENVDTSNVTDMNKMFYGQNELVNLDVSGWDTSKVTDMNQMFYSDKSLTSLDVSKFNTSNVTNMSGMFSGVYLLSLDLSGWDTSKVTDMSNMFNGATNLTSLDVSKFDTSKVTDMSNMFNGATNLTSLDLTNFDMNNASGKLTGMFTGDSKLSKLDLGSNVKFSTDSGLPEPSSDVTTGKWQNVGSGTVDNPNGRVLWTSAQLMSTYTGSGADTYVWQRKAGANVTVKYVDEQGKSIASDVTLSGKMGNAYTTTQKTISGYTFSKVQGNAKGTFTGEAQTVTYVYKKIRHQHHQHQV